MLPQRRKHNPTIPSHGDIANQPAVLRRFPEASQNENKRFPHAGFRTHAENFTVALVVPSEVIPCTTSV